MQIIRERIGELKINLQVKSDPPDLQKINKSS